MPVEQIGREQIDALKNDSGALLSFFQNENDGALARVLGRFGRISNGHSKKPLLQLLKTSQSAKVKSLAIMNLAKIGDVSLLGTFVRFAKGDGSTEVRRESVSAIGRLRSKKAVPALIGLLADEDPKVVMQAVRGLLVFARDDRVKKELSGLLDHPNELIKDFVSRSVEETGRGGRFDAGHTKCPDYMKNAVVLGDTLDVLKCVPDESIHLTFTSPPYYNARDYSIYQSYDAYLGFLQGVFKELHRVTKEGRFFVLNTSPIIIPRISRSHSSKRYPIPYDIHPILIDMGWEFIDDIVWVKPEASVKNRNAGFLQHRKPLAYKPNAVSEMLMVYRKKTSKLIDWNIRQYADDVTERSKVSGDYDTSNVWYVDPTFDRVHSAVFPLELCDRVIKYYSFAGDLVFDPFAGSGTMGRSAAKAGRHFFLTEKEPDYMNRIKGFFNKPGGLFDRGVSPSFHTAAEFAALAASAGFSGVSDEDGGLS